MWEPEPRRGLLLCVLRKRHPLRSNIAGGVRWCRTRLSQALPAVHDGLKGEGHLLPATRADMLRRAGRAQEAAESYREAIALAPTDPERRFLQQRLDSLSASS